MRNKTLVRVVTLLLVALMVLTTFAPAFTAYAAALLTVTETTGCDASGTPDASVFTQEDLPGYQAYAPYECPYCKNGKPLEAIVNGFGYSLL